MSMLCACWQLACLHVKKNLGRPCSSGLTQCYADHDPLSSHNALLILKCVPGDEDLVPQVPLLPVAWPESDDFNPQHGPEMSVDAWCCLNGIKCQVGSGLLLLCILLATLLPLK